MLSWGVCPSSVPITHCIHNNSLYGAPASKSPLPLQCIHFREVIINRHKKIPFTHTWYQPKTSILATVPPGQSPNAGSLILPVGSGAVIECPCSLENLKKKALTKHPRFLKLLKLTLTSSQISKHLKLLLIRSLSKISRPFGKWLLAVETGRVLH